MRRPLAAIIGAMLLTAPVVPAHAAPPPQATSLCTDAPQGCGITVADRTREGATFPVSIHGRAQTRIKIVAYQAIVDDAGQLTALAPLGDGAETLTGSAGVVTTDLGIPAVVEEPSSGWALISIDGVTGTDTSMTLGQFVPFGARRPTVLGDGFGDRKPVGAPMDLTLVGAIPGSRFAVELRQQDELWADITLGDGAVLADPHIPATIQYELPRGLPAEPQQIRLRNVSDSAIAASWLAIPSADGDPGPLRPAFAPPPVGDALDGTSELAAHPTGTVRVVSYGIAAASVGFVALALGWPAVRARRRDAA